MDFNIQDTEKLFYRLIDEANVLFIYLNVLGNIFLCNRKLEDILGKKKQDIVGKYWLNVLYPDQDENKFLKREMFKAIVDDSIAYKRPNTFEGLVTDTNNNQCLISWNITPILSETKNLEGLLCVGHDVTESKEREDSLKKIDETLKNIFSNIKEYGLYVTNLDGNITYYGMGSEVMFGWQKNEIIFKHISTLHSQEDAKTKLPSILEQVKNTGQYEVEIELVKKDGQRFPVNLTVSQFLDADGKLIGYIFIAKDITERKKLEYEIFQAEKLAAIGQLAAGMAHEITNPLFVISGRLEMILEQKRLAKKLKDGLNIINAQTDRIRRLVDRLLKFARKAPPCLETININDVIDSVLPFLDYHKLPVSKVEIEKELTPDLPPIKGDLNQLQEVFVNLFINAYQSMPEGGKLKIETGNFLNKFAEVRITDTGCGISPRDIKNIFMPFFSTKKDGTGLGLSICYNIIKSHNGSIDVESQLNEGTTFIVRLPFA